MKTFGLDLHLHLKMNAPEFRNVIIFCFSSAEAGISHLQEEDEWICTVGSMQDNLQVTGPYMHK